MAGTPSSGTSAYATPQDMVTRYDFRTIGELLIDDEDTTISDPSLITTVGGTYYNALVTLLEDASGLIESACTAAGNYVINTSSSPVRNDLAALTGNSQNMLKRMVCALTIEYLWRRRPRRDIGKYTVEIEEARENLEKIRNGAWIFGILEHQAAGQMNDLVELASDVYNRQGPVEEMSRYFGQRNNVAAGGGFGNKVTS